MTAGPEANLTLVDGKQNSLQATFLGAFYGSCELQNGEEFAVIPVPLKDLPTTWVCGRR
jgi:hypothetical protein